METINHQSDRIGPTHRRERWKERFTRGTSFFFLVFVLKDDVSEYLVKSLMLFSFPVGRLSARS